MNYKLLITIGMWVLGALCVWIMKKIEPDNKIWYAPRQEDNKK